MKLGVFPLPVFLLPGGITQLRIFEPRYIRLVKQAATGEGFALLATNTEPVPSTCSSAIAAWVEIIDFSRLADGLLGIMVQAKNLVELEHYQREADQLLTAEAQVVEHWQTLSVNHIAQYSNQSVNLVTALRGIINQHQQLKSLYVEPHYDDLQWVCARFIELLPLPISDKQPFLQVQSFEQCIHFLHTVINGE